MNESFLLNSEIAHTLYSYARTLPVVDYHNHLPLDAVCGNRRFTDIYDMWIKPDPYKHRAMRMCGVPEKYITGDADSFEKFSRWCSTLPLLLGNQMYHWSLMELKTVFGIDTVPDKNNARDIYESCNAFLAQNKVTPAWLMEKFNVRYACPCASLSDDVSEFENSGLFAPSLRGDDAVNVTSDFVKKLEHAADTKINSLDDYEKAITVRLESFKKAGCAFSDHALDNGFEYLPDDGKNGNRFLKMLDGTADECEKAALASYILTFLGAEYAKRGFVMQLHIGAQRTTSTRLRALAGAAGGYAAIGNSVNIKSLTSFIDALEQKHGLPKTVLFTLNPADNAAISVLSGSYSADGVAGLITQGPAWWWCDHKQGITEMLENAATYGLLSNFIGMTTDSRSFLSFVRHDYFRRILCDWLGKKVQSGELPQNTEALKELVYKMCCGNAAQILNI